MKKVFLSCSIAAFMMGSAIYAYQEFSNSQSDRELLNTEVLAEAEGWVMDCYEGGTWGQQTMPDGSTG